MPSTHLTPSNEKWLQLLLLLLSLYFLLITVSGCVTQKRCYEKYPPQIITKDSIVYKDRMVVFYDTVYIKGDTVNIYDTVVMDRITGLINSDPLMANAEYSQAIAQVINSRLFLNLIQKDTAIARMLEENIKEIEVYRDRTEIVEKWDVRWYHKAGMWFSGAVILLIILRILLKSLLSL